MTPPFCEIHENGSIVLFNSGPLSYSDRLKMNVRRSATLNRKVLEITLEIDENVQLKIEQDDVAKLAARIGLDITVHLEGYQICPDFVLDQRHM